jgi:hypothetical protein
MELLTLVNEFTTRLAALIEAETVQRARTAIVGAFAPSEPTRGRPSLPAKAPVMARRARKKAPRQLCPVPGCKNPPAPVFGMVCSAHKGVAKSKIRKYREARRAAKSAGA